MRILTLFYSFFLFSHALKAQEFTRRDTLRGGERPERSCFDVSYYDLHVSVDPAKQEIAGKNTIFFRFTEPSSRIQLDLFENMIIDRIVEGDVMLSFIREYDAVFIDFNREQQAGTEKNITVHYHGAPVVARMPPWDGGFTWTKDKDGNDWIGVSCQGKGASLWWPTKEVYADEPDSMRIHCTVPNPLMAVCNGTPEGSGEAGANRRTYHWKVSYPINNYNVTLNIAVYDHWQDQYVSEDGEKLDLDYYVLPYNIDVARKQFEQVKPMLTCYEKYLGKYPFYKDGYALVETPYLGMEHQGAIAYGNKFRRGYLGMDRSGQELDFDYIIIHETGHEWWGNSVSARDLADMWIHESFCTYSEAIYVECRWNYDVAMKYVNALKNTVTNNSPMIGIYGLNHEGNGDMYVKGMLFLNTLRHVIRNDELWWRLIYKMSNDAFHIKTTDYDEVVEYFCRESGMDLRPAFDQYVRHKDIPRLDYSIKNGKKGIQLKYRWATEVKDFRMPVDVIADGDVIRLEATNAWQTLKLQTNKIDFDTDKFYYQLNKIR